MTDEILSTNGYISNCCNAGVHLDTEICLECSEPTIAICEFCEHEEGEGHECRDCNFTLTEKQCHEQQGMCNTCLRLIQE